MLLYITLHITHTSHIRNATSNKQASKKTDSTATSMVEPTKACLNEIKEKTVDSHLHTINFMFHGMSYSVR